ncbi:hypothetical protein BHE74_00012720 [Ensete ventricosum]|nr:hypothetical protein BHE74_00012720 [Ensete ventricosum]
MSGVLQAGQPVAFALSCRQPPAVWGAAGWSACRVRFANRAVVLSLARCIVRCGSVRTPDLLVDLTKTGSASDVCLI